VPFRLLSIFRILLSIPSTQILAYGRQQAYSHMLGNSLSHGLFAPLTHYIKITISFVLSFLFSRVNFFSPFRSSIAVEEGSDYCSPYEYEDSFFGMINTIFNFQTAKKGKKYGAQRPVMFCHSNNL
jgi:hypothetical protein